MAGHSPMTCFAGCLVEEDGRFPTREEFSKPTHMHNESVLLSFVGCYRGQMHQQPAALCGWMPVVLYLCSG